jgi:hypothetical protein
MNLPDAATLAFEVEPLHAKRTRIVVTAYFHPAGVKGTLYWHALTPAQQRPRRFDPTQAGSAGAD